MITTVTLNAAVDKTIEIDNFTPGQVNRIMKTEMKAGGKGINVSKVVKSLGGDTLCTGFLGGETGAWINSRLKAMNIASDFVWTDKETRTNIKIIDTYTRQITDINDQGEEINAVYVQQLSQKIEEAAEKSSVMVFSGSLPQNISHDIYKDFVAIAKNKGCKTIVDANGPALIEAIKGIPYMIKPNIHELEDTFHVKINNEEEIAYQCKRLLDQGIGMVVVSMGAEGVVLATETKIWKAEAIPVTVKNTVGAGDTMVAAFAYGIHCGLGIEETLRLAVAASALTVNNGSILHDKAEVQIYAKKVQLREMK
ncbi:MAG: 1-phosphofructokinase [Bacillota bacterium]